MRIIFSIAANLSWPLFQLYVKNAFLYGDLKKGSIWSNLWGMLLRESIKSVVSERQYMDSSRVHGRGLRSLALPSLTLIFNYHSDYFIFDRRTKSGLVILPVRVDDILPTESDSVGLVETKDYLRRHFVTKDMGKAKYF